MRNVKLSRPGRIRSSATILGLAVALVPLGACDELLKVEDPDVVRPDQLEGGAAIPTRVAGAVLDFQIAFNGDFNNALVAAQGMFSDEYVNSETFPDRLEIDRRNIDRSDNQMTLRVYGGLHVARVSARDAADLIDAEDPTNSSLALVRSIEGFSEVLLAETFCSGVPESRFDGNTIVFGQPRTTPEIFEDAIAAFDKALAASPSSNLALIGKARALVNLGRYSDAAAVASVVPTGFLDYVRHSSTTPAQNNGLWSLSTNGRVSLADSDGGSGIAFRSLDDPRVPWIDTGGTGFDGSTRLYLQLLSPEIDSDVPFASGIEARLIEAEAALDAGDRATFFAMHNEARTTMELPNLTDTGQSTDELIDMHFRERALWLHSTAHRVGDLRRLVRQYSRSPESVYPSGAYFKGGTFGSDLNFPIPVEEDNNPNTQPLQQGCIDRNA
jgi:hypothetical protein